MSDFRMNSPEGKAILAMVREADYAHPGEEEAIMLASGLVQRSGIQRLLDVGCGRGGTAAWFDRQGWGQVVGVDVDSASIEYARRHYPGVTFFRRDVADLAQLALDPFDLVYLLTAYYAFSEQRKALGQIRAVCRTGGTLLIVDYTQPGTSSVPPELGGEIGNPMVLQTMTADLAATGWMVETVDDWTPRFVGWYESLLKRFRQRRSDIIEIAGTNWYEYVVRWYGDLHRALADRRLGGAVITARVRSEQNHPCR